ncbi:MAG: class I SAM-dependent methyltransferase [Burkholderiales bacterium]|nr:class I SAM-dependent methyltransferase [Burkholderiales bacterium]
MSASRSSRIAALAFALVALSGTAVHAQDKPAAAAPGTYEPRSGQEGKDVVWVPTPQAVVDKMLEVARVGPRDFVMDLGSGDGRTVITAAKLGARAMGVEYNPDMVALSQRNAEKAGVSERATFVKADLFQTSFAKASVITMFLLPDINLKLRPKILALKPGTRIVSNSFTMGDWEPDVKVDLAGQPGCDNSYCTVLHWVVPRRVAGTYTTAHGEITLKQTFQKLEGTLKSGSESLKIEGRVRGESIEFAAGGKRYRGALKGKSLELQAAG